MLEDFYIEVKKKNTNPDDPNKGAYKTQTLKCIHAALGRFFKEHRGIDIIKNELFIKANDIFLGMTKDNKQKGLREVGSYPPIDESDVKTLTRVIDPVVGQAQLLGH